MERTLLGRTLFCHGLGRFNVGQWVTLLGCTPVMPLSSLSFTSSTRSSQNHAPLSSYSVPRNVVRAAVVQPSQGSSCPRNPGNRCSGLPERMAS